MAELFVDTGAFYAAADRSDTHHVEASETFAKRGAGGDLITTDHVVVETWLLMRARLGRDAAMQFWDAMETEVVRVFGVTASDFASARQIAREWPDQPFSIVDLTSFAAMERLGINQAFAFDTHFRIYRYGPSRSTPFHIIP